MGRACETHHKPAYPTQLYAAYEMKNGYLEMSADSCATPCAEVHSPHNSPPVSTTATHTLAFLPILFAPMPRGV
jgi:hypothetical protein